MAIHRIKIVSFYINDMANANTLSNGETQQKHTNFCRNSQIGKNVINDSILLLQSNDNNSISVQSLEKFLANTPRQRRERKKGGKK